MRKTVTFPIILFMVCSYSFAQQTASEVPDKIDPDQQFLFYLHGGIVQALGANAVSEYYGEYRYHDILNKFIEHGFFVISEVRPGNTVESEYAKKVANQVRVLLNAGVNPASIIVVGASLGGYIAYETASILRDPDVKYVFLGLCSDYAIQYYEELSKSLCGNFLSLYEESDEKRSCLPILLESDCTKGIKEIRLEMGISHGFLYKPYDEWVLPMVEWIEGR